MKIAANVALLKQGLKPALEVATKGIVKDFEHSNKLTLKATKSELVASANGGRLSLVITLSDIAEPNLNYTCDTEGEVTVNASDFASSLEAFDPKANVIVSGDSKELVVASALDKEQFQSLPVFPEPVKTPKIASTFEKEVEITRSAFLEGVNKVYYAVGFEQNRVQYLYWQLKTAKEMARFAAGTGSRFSIYSIEGKIVKGDENLEFLLPKDQTPVIASILNDSEADYVKISSTSVGIPPQITFATDNLTLVLTGIDFNLKWPNIDATLKWQRAARVVTRAEDWSYAVKGLMATYNEEFKKQRDIHESDITLDFDKNNIVVKTDGKLRANRKVPIIDVKEQTKDASFHCCTLHIKEFMDRVDKSEDVFVEYISNDKPLFFLLPKRSNDVAGISTQFFSFFASIQT